MLRAVGGAAAATITAGAISTFYHRPLPDVRDGFWVKSPAITLAATAEEVAAEPLFSAGPSAPPPPLVGAAQAVVSVTIGAFFKAWVCWLHGLHVIDGSSDGGHVSQLQASLAQPPLAAVSVQSHSGGGSSSLSAHASAHAELVALIEAGEGVLTVSNHVSVLDDPVLASLVPWRVVASPSLHRWAICTQEVCFQRDLAAAFFCAGKVLPVKRGAGCDQPMLLGLGRHLAAGHWAHVFPTGRVVQALSQVDTSPAANDRAASAATSKAKEQPRRLKWGVGKLIAHAPTRPSSSPSLPSHQGGLRVVVLAFAGMDRLLPLEADGFTLAPLSLSRLFRLDALLGNGLAITASKGPRAPDGRGADGCIAGVHVAVGRPLTFGDLIGAHEAAHGPLWRYGAAPHLDDPTTRGDGPAVNGSGPRSGPSGWTSSTAAERALYAAITARVDDELRRLEGLLR